MENIHEQINQLKNRIKSPYSPFIDVDEGWYQIVIDCHKELEAIDPDYELCQVKEKFGSLRYYYDPSDLSFRDAMDAVVAKYQKMSEQTCEVTGEPGVLMKSIGRWYKTLNPEFAKNHMSYAKYTIVDEK